MKIKRPKSEQQKEFKGPWTFKLTLLLLMLSLFNVNASTSHAQSKKVTVLVEKGSLSEFFEQIENQTPYRFFYNSSEINNQIKVNAVYKNTKLSEVLASVLEQQNFTFNVLDHQIVLTKASPMEIVASQMAIQEKTLKGIVTTEQGTPLTGVTVTIEGSDRGVVTNFDGEYTIKLRDTDEVLKFIYLGFKTQVVKIDDQDIINVVMVIDIAQLDELVLIGYGEQKREDVSGSVSSVKTENIIQSSIGNIGFDRALGGLAKGVQVTQSSGRPGSPSRLNIRGITSPRTGLNQPLYVIDGVAMEGTRLLLTISPNDIESFDILKDAAATSIYGSRGANGVVLIQTKRGKRGQNPTVNFSATTSIARPINTINVLNTHQYRGFYDQLMHNSVNAINAGQLDPFITLDLENIANVDLDFSTLMASYDGLREDYFGNANTNWSDLVYRNPAVTKQTNFSIRGGGSKTNYNLSLAVIDQDGLVVKDKFKQYNMRLSLDTDVNEYIELGGFANLSHTESNSGEDAGIGQYNVNTSIARARPDLPAYDENGALLGQSDFGYGMETLEPNPLMRLQHKNNAKGYNFMGNTYLEIEPIKKLKIKADANASVFYNKNSTFTPKITDTDFIVFPNESYLNESNGLVTNFLVNLTANYDFRLSSHHFNILGGIAWDRTNFDSSSQFFAGFPDDDVLIDAASAESAMGYSSSRMETGLNSMFTRLTYNYKNRYNATINFRTDASSKFGPGNKRGYFPSLSASWNISNENFLYENEKVNDLRLRASIGRVGSTNVSDYAYLQFFQTSSGDIYNGNSAILPTDNFPNQDIGWETTDEINIGLDFSFFDSRLRGGIDVYNRKTTGALARTPFPLELGPRTYNSNFIDVSNKGVELSLGGDIVRSEDFTWTANVNWAVNRNKLEKLKGANIDDFLLDYFVEGEPVGTIKGYKVVKIFDNQGEIDALNGASPTGLYDQSSTGIGDYMIEDTNGDGRITSDDRTIIGDIEPDFFGGISNTFTYKAFSLSALFQFSVGAEALWDPVIQSTYNGLGENKYSEYAMNTWTPENPDARFARALFTDPSSSGRSSDRYLYDTSYLRLKSLQLTYSLDSNLLKKAGIDNAMVTLTANNLYTWTKWPGIDPEALSERGSITDQTSGEDPYPLAKSFSLGFQLQF